LFLRQSRNELFRVSLNAEQNQVENEKSYRDVDIPEDFFIYQLLGKIVLCSPAGFYFFDSNEHFVPDEKLNRLFEFSGKNISFRSVMQTSTAIWALGKDVMTVKYNNSASTCYHTIPLISAFERIYPVDDSSIIIPNENGFALWNTTTSIKKPDYLLQIINKKIIKGNNNQEDDDIQTDITGDLKIPYKNNSLLVEYGIISYFNPYKVQFRSRLDNEEWSPFSFTDVKMLSDIPIGTHTFKVEAQLENGKILEDSFSFVVLPPWYLTIGAYLVYIVLLLLLFFLLWKLDNRRIEQKERQMKMIQEKELELKEEAFKTETEKKEQEIIRLTNEKLEMDVRHKSQELANSAIILGRKNELLIEIKKSLSHFFNKSGHEVTQQELMRKILDVNHVIDENIREDDIIHKFEENFDFVHNNFIKRLTETFPSLTVSERKICTYIKMQLTSKEIAPLLNITVRGVETVRLRLRKKLGLQNKSLTKFLSNF
jgi:DNA-binding CsgD family transcriptional regulator